MQSILHMTPFNRTIIELKRRSIWAEDDRYHLLIGLS